jgi:hypothetical protein
LVNIDEVDTPSPLGQRAGDYDIAVVIGNKNYRSPGVSQVEYADRDAREMKNYLGRTFGYSDRNIIYAEDAGYTKFIEIFGPDGQPTKGRLYKLTSASKGRSRVFIYYVGHGAPDLNSQEAYIVPVDADLGSLDATGYSLKTLYANLDAVSAKSITIVLDTCFAGSSEKGMLFKGISPALVKVKDNYNVPKKAVLFASGTADQVSTWFDEKQHSLFTYYFLKGIRGDADGNGDSAVTVGEMRAYLLEKVPFEAQLLKKIQQTPVVIGNDADILVTLKK